MTLKSNIRIGLVLSALATCPAHSATLVDQDNTTQGNWGGVYGSDGYLLFSYNGPLRTANREDLTSLPDYVSSVETTLTGYTWGAPNPNPVTSGDPQFSRVLENPAGPLADRSPATLFNNNGGTITINLNAPRTFQLAVYSLDWDNGRQSQNVEVSDQNGASEVQEISNPGFRDGVWGVFEVSGDPTNPIVITLTKTDASPNAVIGGILFDPVDGSSDGPTITAIAYNPETESVTLTWRAQEDTAYLVQYSLTMDDGWVSDLEDGLGFVDDEVADDGEFITKTFDLREAGIEPGGAVFFRIEVEE